MVHIVGPLSLVRLALHMGELAEAMGPTQIPATLVRGPISEVHHALAMAEPSQPLSFIGGARGSVAMRPDL